MRDLCPRPGAFRDGHVRVGQHTPPEGRYVSDLVQEMCERAYAESEWDAVKTSAYVFWRLNWIHPFRDGNGRTSRAVLMIRYAFVWDFCPNERPPSRNTSSEIENG